MKHKLLQLDKQVILGWAVGSLAMLTFSLGSLFLSGYPEDSIISQEYVLFNLVIIIMSPFAGGFIAGLIGRSNPRRAGILSGVVGSMVLFILWLVFAGITWQGILSGLVLVFVWVFFARLGGGFASPR